MSSPKPFPRAAGLATLCLLAACSSSDPATTPGDTPSGDAGADTQGQDAATDTSVEDAPDATSDIDAGTEAEVSVDAGVTSIDELVPAAADAMCTALFRCCDAESMEDYFAAATYKPSLKPFQDQVPPAVTLDVAGCRAVVAQMLALVPFGGWIENVEAGRVNFAAGGVNDCYNELAAAACGKNVAAALADGTCFGFEPPSGGTSQRRMFKRIQNPGAACVPVLQDGFGAGFYGTCDPTKAFCCIDDPDNPAGGCGLPAQGMSGTCVAAGTTGDTCEVMPPLDLCVSGMSCDSSTGTCIADSHEPLSLGDPCVDGSYNLLGVCQDSWCDLMGTRVCEQPKVDGADCFEASECDSDHCENPGPSGQCAPWTFCVAP